MTVWIDDMYKYPMGEFRGMKMSHMIATTEAELHAFAKKIGLRKEWYQKDHYDVSLGYRTKAVKLGAVEIDLRLLAYMVYCKRVTGTMPTPRDAAASMKVRAVRRKREFEEELNPPRVRIKAEKLKRRK